MSHEAAGWETRKFAGPIWILPLRDCGSVLAVIANATVPAPVVLPRFEVIWIHPCAVAGAHSQVVATLEGTNSSSHGNCDLRGSERELACRTELPDHHRLRSDLD